ncbi:MAG: hypothetical protein ACREYE_23770 [Gammaproteobacteria bacterium]
MIPGNCQAVSGRAYVSVAVFPADAVTVTQGELTTWLLKTLPRQKSIDAVSSSHRT